MTTAPVRTCHSAAPIQIASLRVRSHTRQTRRAAHNSVATTAADGSGSKLSHASPTIGQTVCAQIEYDSVDSIPRYRGPLASLPLVHTATEHVKYSEFWASASAHSPHPECVYDNCVNHLWSTHVRCCSLHIVSARMHGCTDDSAGKFFCSGLDVGEWLSELYVRSVGERVRL